MAQRAPLGGMSSLSDFTREWGAAETASMCFLLLSRASTHAPVRRAALELLSSPALTRADPVAPSERNTSAGHAPIVPYERPRALTASKWYPPSSVVLPSSQGMVAQGSLAPPPLRRWGIGGINTIAAMFQGSSSTHGRKDVAQEARHGGQPSILQWHPPMVWPIPGAVRAYDGTGEVLSTALSAANQGLWLALSRMLLPYWDSTFFIKRKSMPGKGVQKAGALAFRPPLPVDHLQATRDALVMLHGALKDR